MLMQGSKALFRNSLNSRTHIINNRKLAMSNLSPPKEGTGKAMVALCGAGIANCVAARTLAEHGIEVHVFEAGRGAGGRSSTRRIGEYQFDHGAQYIGSTKTTEFQNLLATWKRDGVVKEWQGNFVSGEIKDQQFVFSNRISPSPRYVGSPTMNTICKKLLEHPNIQTTFGGKVTPVLSKSRDGELVWRIQAGDGAEYGNYEWVIAGDRSIAGSVVSSNQEKFPEQMGNLKSGFVTAIENAFTPVPSLALMLVMGTLPRSFFPYDSVTLKNHAIEWISRDSTKPNRERDDGKECFVVQTSSAFAIEIMNEVAKRPDDATITFDERKERVNQLCQERLLPEFKSLLETIASTSMDQSNLLVLKQVVSAMVTNAVLVRAHRWSAAFPSLSQPLDQLLDAQSYNLGQKQAYVDANIRFAACGDYLVVEEEGFGKIEGAALSGVAAANAIFKKLSLSTQS